MREGGREGGLSKKCCIFLYHDSLEEYGRFLDHPQNFKEENNYWEIMGAQYKECGES